MEKHKSAPNSKLITLPELGRRYGLSRQTIRHAIETGGLPTFDCGTNWPRVRVTDVESWVTSTQIDPNEFSSPKAAA